MQCLSSYPYCFPRSDRHSCNLHILLQVHGKCCHHFQPEPSQHLHKVHRLFRCFWSQEQMPVKRQEDYLPWSVLQEHLIHLPHLPHFPAPWFQHIHRHFHALWYVQNYKNYYSESELQEVLLHIHRLFRYHRLHLLQEHEIRLSLRKHLNCLW